MNDDFKFGFWNYLQTGIISPDIVLKWKEMHSNLFMSFRYLENKSKKEDMLALLDAAQKVGCKVIINDERCEYLRLNKMSKEDFIKGVKESIEDFGSHPATFGFYGGDEPFSDQEENFCFTMSLLKELSPNQKHFGNLLPYWSGLLAEPNENNREDEFYYEKINRLIKEGRLDILAYDQYTQCYNECKDQKLGIRQYLNGLYHFSQIARMNNVPLYVSLLAIEHYSYREPTETDIRWQINSAAIFGAKAVIWFYFHQTIKDYGFSNPPFLGEKAYITPMYGKIQRQQYIFEERYKEVFDNVEIEKISFMGEDFQKLNYSSDKILVDRLDQRYKDLLSIISYGHYKEEPERKVIIVMNADQNKSNAYSIYFTKGDECHFDLIPGEIRIFDRK